MYVHINDTLATEMDIEHDELLAYNRSYEMHDVDSSDSESENDESEILTLTLTNAWEHCTGVFNYVLQTHNTDLHEIMNYAKAVLQKQKVKQMVNNNSLTSVHFLKSICNTMYIFIYFEL